MNEKRKFIGPMMVVKHAYTTQYASLRAAGRGATSARARAREIPRPPFLFREPRPPAASRGRRARDGSRAMRPGGGGQSGATSRGHGAAAAGGARARTTAFSTSSLPSMHWRVLAVG